MSECGAVHPWWHHTLALLNHTLVHHTLVAPHWCTTHWYHTGTRQGGAPRVGSLPCPSSSLSAYKVFVIQRHHTFSPFPSPCSGFWQSILLLESPCPSVRSSVGEICCIVYSQCVYDAIMMIIILQIHFDKYIFTDAFS